MGVPTVPSVPTVGRVPGARTVTPFLYDSFTGADATALVSHTGEIGATWTEHPDATWVSGAAQLFGNRARASTAPTAHYVSGTPATADYKVEALFKCITLAGRTYIGARMHATQRTGYFFGYHAGNTEWQLLKFVNGASSTMAIFDQTVSVGAEHEIRMELRSEAIVCYVDDVEVISVLDFEISSAGKPGVFASQASATNTGIHCDWLSATNLEPEVAPAAPTTWNGDFSTGDKSQWDTEQAVHTDLSPHVPDGPDIEVITPPSWGGTPGVDYSATVTVHENDSPIAPPERDRAELALSINNSDGFNDRSAPSVPMEVPLEFVVKQKLSSVAGEGRLTIWCGELGTLVEGSPQLAEQSRATKFPDQNMYFKLGAYKGRTAGQTTVIEIAGARRVNSWAAAVA